MATAQESMQLLISPVLAVASICTRGAYLALSAAQASIATVCQRDSCMNSYADPDLLLQFISPVVYQAVPRKLVARSA